MASSLAGLPDFLIFFVIATALALSALVPGLRLDRGVQAGVDAAPPA